ncbi:MAG: hypothetical protein Fur0022_27520 [Anaerolineales bacterium]
MKPFPFWKMILFSPGILLIGYVAFSWASALVREWGYLPYRPPGLFIGFAVWLGFIFATWFVDFLLNLLNLTAQIRAALWMSAVVGPYAGMMAYDQWGHPIWSQVISLVSAVVAFSSGLMLEKIWGKTIR